MADDNLTNFLEELSKLDRDTRSLGSIIADTTIQLTKLVNTVNVQRSKISKANDDIQLSTELKNELHDEMRARSSAIDIAQEMVQEKQNLINSYQSEIDGIQQQITARDMTVQEERTLHAMIGRYSEKINITQSLLDPLHEELDALIEEQQNAILDFSELSNALDSANDNLTQVKTDMIKTAFSATTEAAKVVTTALIDFSKIVRKTQREFGISAGQAANLKFSQLTQSITSTSGTILSLGKDAAVSTELIQQAQIAFQREFGGVISSGAAEELASQAREMGVSVSELASARRAFLTTTFGDVSAAVEQQERAIAAFEDKGLTARDAVEFIGSNAELIARSGTRFQDSLIRAAAEAKKIGVDLSKVNQVGDNIIGDFEGFLISMAELGAMGFGFDAVRLAEIAESGNTGALFQELQSQLAMTGKDLQNLRRSEQLALSQAFGMDIAEFQRLAGIEVEGGGESMEDLQTKSNAFLERLVNLVDALARPISLMSAAITGTISIIQTKLLAQIALNSGVGAMGGGIGTILTGLGPLARGGIGTMGVLGAIGSTTLAYNAAKEDDTTMSVLGILGAALSGAAIGGAATSFTGPGAIIGALIGATTGVGAAIAGNYADDMISRPGYGERTLVTPQGPIALNNEDNVIAYADDMISREAEGITLLSKGALTQEAPEVVNNINVDMSRLERKLDAVVDAFRSTKIQLDGNNVGKVILDNERATRLRAGLLSQRT